MSWVASTCLSLRSPEIRGHAGVIGQRSSEAEVIPDSLYAWRNLTFFHVFSEHFIETAFFLALLEPLFPGSAGKY